MRCEGMQVETPPVFLLILIKGVTMAPCKLSIIETDALVNGNIDEYKCEDFYEHDINCNILARNNKQCRCKNIVIVNKRQYRKQAR